MSPPENLAEPDSSLIVNNPAPDPEHPAFRISPAPVKSAGVMKGDTTTELWRVMDAMLTQTGKLVVINPQDEVRVMDAAGKLVRRVGSIGRPGAGPEDIQWATQLSAAEGDSFRVLDLRLGRISTFDTAAKSVRTTLVPTSIFHATNIVCCFADGSFLIRARGRRGYMTYRTQVRERVDWSIGQHVMGAAQPNRILTLEGDDPLGALHSGGLFGGTSYPNMPFTRTAFVKLSDHTIVYGIGDRYEYRVYAQDGRLLRVVRAAATAVPVTGKDLGAARKSFTSGYRSRDMQRSTARTFDRFTLRVIRFSRGHVILREPPDSNGFVALRVHRIVPRSGLCSHPPECPH